MIPVAVGVILGLVASRKLAQHLVSDGTLSGTVVGSLGMLAAAISGGALGFVVSTIIGVVLPVQRIQTTSRIVPLMVDGTFVQKGTRDNSKYYRFIDESGVIQTVPLVQTSFLYTAGTQRITTIAYTFPHRWESWLSSPLIAPEYKFELNKLSPTNVVTAAFH